MFAIESAFAEEPVQTTCQLEEPSHPVFETGAEDQPIVQTSQHPKWFSQPRRQPTPDRDWNKTLPAAQGNAHNGTLNDVHNALDDHLKGIRMQYLLTTIWRRGDKDRAMAMI
nr:hypothetical protein [Tanacetum cinerariifolium]